MKSAKKRQKCFILFLLLIFIFKKIISVMIVSSVTRWSDYSSNFWPFTTMSMCPTALKSIPKKVKKFCQRNPQKQPNLVTLRLTHIFDPKWKTTKRNINICPTVLNGPFLSFLNLFSVLQTTSIQILTQINYKKLFVQYTVLGFELNHLNTYESPPITT